MPACQSTRRLASAMKRRSRQARFTPPAPKETDATAVMQKKGE